MGSLGGARLLLRSFVVCWWFGLTQVPAGVSITPNLYFNRLFVDYLDLFSVSPRQQFMRVQQYACCPVRARGPETAVSVPVSYRGLSVPTFGLDTSSSPVKSSRLCRFVYDRCTALRSHSHWMPLGRRRFPERNGMLLVFGTARRTGVLPPEKEPKLIANKIHESFT